MNLSFNQRMIFIFLGLFLIVFSAGFANAEQLRINGNVGLYNEVLESKVVVEKSGFEQIYNVSVEKLLNGEYEISYFINNDLVDDKDKLKEKEVCEDFFSLEKDNKKGSEYQNCVDYLKEIENGLKVTNLDGKVVEDIKIDYKDKKIKTKLGNGKDKALKFGDNSIYIYLEDNVVDFVVSKEEEVVDWCSPYFDLCRDDRTINIYTDSNFSTNKNDWLLTTKDTNTSFPFTIYYKDEWIEEYDYNYPIWNNDLLTIIDYNSGIGFKKYFAWRELDENTVLFDSNTEFKLSYFFNGDFVRYNVFWKSLFIDPVAYRSVSANDLNHNFFFNGWVKNSPQLLNNAWTPTGELDWNIESVNTTTSGGWGQLGIDFNIIDDSNVVASYNFNGNVNDFFGNYNLTCSGTEDYSTGLWATQGGEFDNATYCKTSYTYTSTEYAIGGWFKTTATGTHGLISTRDPFSPYKGFGIDMRAKAGKEGTLFFGQKDATYDESINPDIVVNDGRWHHVVGQFTGTKMQLFIDGKLAGEYSTTSVINKGSEIFIGRLYRTTNNYYWDGQIEDAFFYAQAMTEEQVSEMYLEQKGSWLDENLIAYYKFNESSGTTVFDSARGHNGTLVGGADIGERGVWDTNSLYLDGVGDYVTAGYNSLILNPDDSFSASAWVKRTYNKTGFIITDENSSYYGWRLYYNSFNASLAFLFQRPSGYSLASASFPYDNEWHHVAFTYGGCENFYTCLNIYIDGEEESNVTAGSSFSGERYQSDFSIGRVGYSSSDTFQGNIDEVKLWREELTEEEIIADYNLFLENKFVDVNIVDATGTTDWNSIRINKDINYNFGRELTLNEGYFTDLNLIGLWHLNNNATDATGNNDGTANGITYDTGLWGTDSATFDNSTDYINVGSDYLVFGNPAFTINTWVKPNTFTGANQYIYGEAVNIGNIVNLSLSDQNYFRFGYRGTINWSYINFGGSPIDLDKWYMVTVAYTPSTGTGKVYLNGVDSTNQTATYSGSLSGYSFLRNTIGNSPYHLNTYNFNGQIEETAIWDKVLSEQEITDLYRKYATKLDLNVYSCSDANCSTITDSEYISDANNNSWMDISTLTSSQYLGYSAYFKPIDELIGYDAGRFFVNSFLQDVNINYVLGAVNYDLNLLIKDSTDDSHIANVLIDSNDDSLDGTFSSPKIYSGLTSADYNIIASRIGYDSNSILFTLDSDQTQTIYLDRKYHDINFSFFRLSNGADINLVSTDFNLGLSGENYDQDLNTWQVVTMREGSYLVDFSKAGYDSNTSFELIVDSDKDVYIYLNKNTAVNFYVRDSNTLEDLNFVSGDLNVDSYDFADQNSPYTQDMVIGDYNGIFSKAGYDFNTISWSITNDDDLNIFVYLDVIPPADINWINPLDGNTMNTYHPYFNISQSGSKTITDFNYIRNGVQYDFNKTNYCTGLSSNNVYCLFVDENIVPYSWNDLNLVVLNSGGIYSSSDVNFYYDPTAGNGTDFNAVYLEQQIIDLNDAINQINTDIEDLNVAILEDRVDDLNIQIIQLQQDVADLNTLILDVNSLSSDLNILYYDLNDLVYQNIGDITILQNNYYDLNNNFVDLNTEFWNLHADFYDLNIFVYALEQRVNDINSQVIINTTNISDLNILILDINSNIYNVLLDMNSVININVSNISDLNDLVYINISDIADINAQVQTNTTNIAINSLNISDINSDYQSFKASFISDVWDDDLNAYSDIDRTQQIFYGEQYNAGSIIYLKGSSDTNIDLPTHYTLRGVVTLLASNNQAYEVSNVSSFYIIDGYLYTNFIMPEVPVGDYNILIEVWDIKKGYGNDIIRGATDVLLLGGEADPVFAPSLNKDKLAELVDDRLYFQDKEERSKYFGLNQSEFFLLSILLPILILALYVFVGIFRKSIDFDMLVILLIILFLIVMGIWLLFFGLEIFNDFANWIYANTIL